MEADVKQHNRRIGEGIHALQTHCPVYGSQSVPGSVPLREQLQVEQVPSVLKPYKPRPQESHRRPPTPDLHSHWPLSGSQNRLREPRGSQSHGMQPSGWERFQKPNSQWSHVRPEKR